MTFPKNIGSYRVERSLGGHDREVYFANHPQRPNSHFVLAMFDVGPEQRADLEAESAHCARLDHPAITKVADLFEHDGRTVLAFESVPGTSLDRLLEHMASQNEKLSDGAVIFIAQRMFEALAAAHAATDENRTSVPLIHGQLGLNQLFVSWTGDVQLLGLGMSMVFRLGGGIDIPIASAPYVAPEVHAGGALTVRANVYSAAAIVWSLLTQRSPLDGRTPKPLRLLRPDLPYEVGAAIDHAMQQVLTMRLVTAKEVAQKLEASGLSDQKDVRGHAEELRAIESFGASTFGPESFPPAALANVKPASVPAIISIPPDSDAFSDMVTIPPAGKLPQHVSTSERPTHPYLKIDFDLELPDLTAPRAVDDDDAVTIPAPARKKTDDS